MAKPNINLKHPWEIDEEETETLEPKPLEAETTELEVVVEEEIVTDDASEELPPDEEPEPEAEPPKKEQRPIARHIIPVHPDFAEELWGQPLTSEQRQRLEEDWSLGFRQLTQAEQEWYGISDDPETYSSMEALSKNYLKVVANQGKENLINLEDGAGEYGWPEGYLKDKNGRFTKECVAELLNMRDYTCEYVLPREPDGRTDLKKYKRGDLNPKRKIRVTNDQYGQRFSYWEFIRDRARRWREWKKERDQAIPIFVEVNGEASFGELITTPLAQAQVQEDISAVIQRIEELERQMSSMPEQFKKSIRAALKPQWDKAGLELRAEGIAHIYETAVTGNIQEDESTDSNEHSTTIESEN